MNCYCRYAKLSENQQVIQKGGKGLKNAAIIPSVQSETHQLIAPDPGLQDFEGNVLLNGKINPIIC